MTKKKEKARQRSLDMHASEKAFQLHILNVASSGTTVLRTNLNMAGRPGHALLDLYNRSLIRESSPILNSNHFLAMYVFNTPAGIKPG